MEATKPKDLQRLYKVIECPAIFIIFYIIRVVYDNKKILSRSNISHVHNYSYGRRMRIHYMDCIGFCTNTNFLEMYWRMGSKIIDKRKRTMEIKAAIVQAVLQM